MFNETRFMSTSEGTLVTCEWFSLIVYLHMDSQIASRCKLLVAYLTQERFFSRVSPVVLNQLCIPSPSPAARFTYVAFHPLHCCVCEHVSSKTTTVCRDIVASVALVRAITGVQRSNVDSKSTFAREPLITHLTGKRFLPRVSSKMLS